VEGIVRVIDSPPEISQAENPDASCSNSAPYKVYNIGNSSPVQLMEYIAAIEKQLGKTAQKEFLPMQPGDVPRTDADITDLMANLGYKPDTPVEKGIERFVAWYKNYFKQ
jgi:UDP-glucuronate 4-epimerase